MSEIKGYTVEEVTQKSYKGVLFKKAGETDER